jgi:hypothetical protein
MGPVEMRTSMVTGDFFRFAGRHSFALHLRGARGARTALQDPTLALLVSEAFNSSSAAACVASNCQKLHAAMFAAMPFDSMSFMTVLRLYTQ